MTLEDATRELGCKCTDIVTGFEGVAIGKVFYATGCNQVLLTPTVDKDGKRRDAEWFDEQRIRITGDKTIFNNVNPGCDLPAPKR